MNDDLFQRFTEVSRNLKLFPLFSSADIERFRVAYGRRTLAKLENDLLALKSDDKLIFTGHMGCGKSTLLNELALNMRKQGLFVSYFSIAQVVEMSAVNHINILYSIALKLLQRAVNLQVEIPESVQTSLKNWFTPNISQAYRKVTCNSLSAKLLADQAK